MKDPIERQAAIDAIEERKNANGYSNVALITELNRLEGYMMQLPSSQPEQRWIPCGERLPKVREWVLCQCRAGIMDVLRLTEDGDWSKNYPHAKYMSGFVIAWIPLPEPYKVERREDE